MIRCYFFYPNMEQTLTFDSVQKAEDFLEYLALQVEHEKKRMHALKTVERAGYQWDPSLGKIDQIKNVRDIFKCSILEAKHMVDKAKDEWAKSRYKKVSG